MHPSLLVASVAARLERARFLKMLLNRDGLTRLLTHSSFMEQARALVERKQPRAVNGARPTPATMVILDIDHFKTINDSYGHQAGDRVLKSLSALLRRHVRRSDLIGRYGGEEFAILLDSVHENDSVRLMMRLLREFGQLEHRARTAAFPRHLQRRRRAPRRAGDGSLRLVQRRGQRAVRGEEGRTQSRGEGRLYRRPTSFISPRDFICRYSSRPYLPNSRPMPDRL